MKTNQIFMRLFIVCAMILAITIATLTYSTSQSGSTSNTSGAPAEGGTPPEGPAQEYSPQSREYHLKAAFLRYVAKFVEWPAQTITGGAINLCVLGLVPSFEALNSINEKIVNDQKIIIQKVPNAKAALGHCQILFVTKTEQDNLKSIIDTIQNLPILGFGDMDNFAELGGNMNFYIANNRLAIMINPPAVEKSQLKISERMLKVVTVIPPVSQKKPTT